MKYIVDDELLQLPIVLEKEMLSPNQRYRNPSITGAIIIHKYKIFCNPDGVPDEQPVRRKPESSFLTKQSSSLWPGMKSRKT